MELLFGQNRLTTLADETVLQALTRQGIAARSSCRGGVCQTCVMRCLKGEIPARSQSGLNAELLAKRYFMPCVCQPTGDMELAEPDADDFFVTALMEKRVEDESGILFLFEPMSALATPVNELIVLDDQGRRARFPLANKPELDYYFGIYLPNTDLSHLACGWRDSLQAGGQIRMRTALVNESPVAEMPARAERPKDPPPDPELWAVLDNGVLLRKILEEFYVRVYADPQLKSFFVGFTQARLVEKQYSFLQQVITGNKVYFGNRPLKTHHWMVISDALLDHREQIMLDCIHEHGLEEKWVKRWMALEEYYRPDIVKSEPFPLQNNGVDIPLEGFEELVIDVGSMCDGCGSVIEPGETVRYHVRMGTIFCGRCNTTKSL
jgi:ferredoxin/truncated hemoglobin YjbI